MSPKVYCPHVVPKEAEIPKIYSNPHNLFYIKRGFIVILQKNKSVRIKD